MPPSKAESRVAVVSRRLEAIPLVIGGLPSAESIFAIHFAVEIARRVYGQAKAVPLNTGEDGEVLAEEVVGEMTVPFFDTPDNEARSVLTGLKAPIVLIMGDFAETARFCMVARSLDLLQACRFVSQSFSCLEALQGQERVQIVAIDRTTPLPQWIDEVAGWLGLQPSSWETARRQMLSDYAAWTTVAEAMYGLVQPADPSNPAWDVLPPAEHPMLTALGASYRTGSIDRVFWPWECLLDPNKEAVAVEGTIDLTGPARILTIGPFMHLPPGQWLARYQFEIDYQPFDNLLEFDVLNGAEILVSGRAPIDGGGKFAFDCAFEIVDSRLPVENRAILVEGSLGGHFTPIGVWLRRDR